MHGLVPNRGGLASSSGPGAQAPSRQQAPACQAAGRGALAEPAPAASPPWAGDTLLSRAVNTAISIKPLYAAMTVLAKQVLKNTAHKNGVAWDATLQSLTQALPELEELRRGLEDPAMPYPAYYRQPFHGYEAGNLCWLAACEIEPATLSMGLRTFPGQGLGPEAAQDKLRAGISRATQAYATRHGLGAVRAALDVGCSVGVSTRCLAAAFPAAAVTGLDLSPYFLAVAEHRRRALPEALRERIGYRHALMEATGLPPASLDLVSVSFVLHECPPPAIKALLAEARRLLRPGGVLALSDNNPRSETLQKLPPALFTLMKSTEPWSDLYYQMDIEQAVAAAGFGEVVTEAVDHRHRTILAVAA